MECATWQGFRFDYELIFGAGLSGTLNTPVQAACAASCGGSLAQTASSCVVNFLSRAACWPDRSRLSGAAPLFFGARRMGALLEAQ